MQNLLSLYLTEHRNCPLPGIGTLHIFNEDSAYYSADRVFKAPVQTIKLFREELPTSDLLDFIMEHQQVNREDAEYYLKDYCYRLKNDDDIGLLSFDHLGHFTRKHGRIDFEALQISGLFFPDAHQPKTERKLSDSQEILVGDNTSTVSEMSHVYQVESELEEFRPDKSWMEWALGLFILAIVVIGLYFVQHGFSGFGNGVTINPEQENTTYTTGK